MAFTIAIIGRPNVGKSTLFNKLVGRSHAIVDDTPGVTRDRREAKGSLGIMNFRVIDTAGLESDGKNKQLESEMIKQTEQATLDADLCLFVLDSKVGVIPEDIYFAEWLKQNKRKAILIANKCDNFEGEIFDKEYYRLGLGQAIAISAEHKGGFNLLYDKIEPYYSEYQEQFGSYEDWQSNEKTVEEEHFQIAIVGRPNSGKSTFLNQLLGQNRVITGPQAGITRDAIAIDWKFGDYKIKLIDTAGIRKKSNIVNKLEQLSLLDSFRAIRYAQIVILLIDANLVLDSQDIAIASMVIKEGRGLLFGINKFDLIKDQQNFIREVRLKIAETLPAVAGAPILPISAINGYNVEKLIKEAIKVYEQWQVYIPTAKLNEWLKIAESKHQPIMVKGKPARLKYITQAKRRPPTFTIFTNYPKAIQGAYEKYLLNFLRQSFEIQLIPIRLIVKKSENPFAEIEYKKFSKKRESGLNTGKKKGGKKIR